MKFKSIGVLADKHKMAKTTLDYLVRKYKFISLHDNPQAEIDVVVALGGDGFMLHTLHDYMEKKIPVYGMNCGTVGFLMNENFFLDGKRVDFLQKLDDAKITSIHPLKMIATGRSNKITEALAINEVSLLRRSGQAAKIRIKIDDNVYMKELVCDGILVSTPAGSTAYNFSINGPILPLNSNLLALTPISPFRPRRWHGALLPRDVKVEFEILTHKKRPVNASADYIDVKDILSVQVREERSVTIRLLFDPGNSLEERIIKEQFAV